MRRQLAQAEWDKYRTAFLAGAGLRQLARTAGISESSMCSRARREKWSEQAAAARSLVAQAQQSDAQDLPAVVPPAQAAALTTAEGKPVLSLAEKRTFLRSVVTTPIGEVDETSALAQSVKRRTTTARNGDVSNESEIKLPDKLRALELDAKLAGELGGDDPRHGPLVSLTLVSNPAIHALVREVEDIEPEQITDAAGG